MNIKEIMAEYMRALGEHEANEVMDGPSAKSTKACWDYLLELRAEHGEEMWELAWNLYNEHKAEYYNKGQK